MIVRSMCLGVPRLSMAVSRQPPVGPKRPATRIPSWTAKRDCKVSLSSFPHMSHRGNAMRRASPEFVFLVNTW